MKKGKGYWTWVGLAGVRAVSVLLQLLWQWSSGLRLQRWVETKPFVWELHLAKGNNFWFRLSRKAMFLLHVFSFPVWVELRTQILLKCINSFLNVSYQSGRNERNYWSTPEGQSFKLVYFTRCIVKKKKSNAALMPSQRCGRTVLSIEQDNRLGSASN